MPISAFCSTEDIWQVMMSPNPFIHTTTTGGGALACSAAIAAIHVTMRDRIWEMAAAKGNYLIPKLKDLAARYPRVYREITGRGLLIGMHFHNPELGYKVAAGLFKRGALVKPACRLNSLSNFKDSLPKTCKISAPTDQP